jgi:hypothetical protein
MIDASGTGDANNTFTVSDFNFGGGSAGATDLSTSTGGFSGDLNSTVTLTDSSVINSYAAGFTSGSTLSFIVTMTTNPDSTLDPTIGLPGDQFAFFLLDNTLNPIPTTNACGPADSGECALLIATVEQNGMIDVDTYSSELTGQVVATSPVAVTPEPTTLALVGTGFVALGWMKRKRQK